MAATIDSVIATLKRAVKPLYFLLLPAAYVAGQAYHEGYLGHFKISASLLPLSASETYTQAFIGSVGIFSLVSQSIGELYGSHPIVMWLSTLLVVLVFALLLHRSAQPGAAATSNATQSIPRRTRRRTKFLGILKDFGGTVFVTATLLYMFLAGLFVFLLFTVLIIKSFTHAGEVAAAKAEKEGFKDAAIAYVKRSSTANEEKFKVISCSSQFCALLSNQGTSVISPTSAVTWIDHADSDHSAPQPSKAIEGDQMGRVTPQR